MYIKIPSRKQLQSRRPNRAAPMGVRPVRARTLHLPEPGRHRRQTSAAHQLVVATRRTLRSWLRFDIDRVRGAVCVHFGATGFLSQVDVLPGRD